jgi:CHASE3 domain sensor protein
VKRMIRKAIFVTGVAAVLAFIVVNGYFAVQNLRGIRDNAALRQETVLIQADISAALLSVVDLESAQRGYLLTEDTSYLQPYTAAVERLAPLLSSLRSKLSSRPADERELEAQLETVIQSKLAEADETIRLRQQGYRSRAFRIVKTNRGKELMDQARTQSASLLAAETNRLSDHEQQTNASIERALTATLGWNSLLLIFTALVFALLWVYSQRLERAVVRGSYALREKSAQLQAFTQTVSHELPELLREVQASFENFLNHFGDYLPGRGQEHAAQIKDMAAQSNRLMTNSLGRHPASGAA